MVNSSYFSLGENLNFPEFLKKIYNINYRSISIQVNLDKVAILTWMPFRPIENSVNPGPIHFFII